MPDMKNTVTNVLKAYDGLRWEYYVLEKDLHKAREAIHEIAPWLSASLSDSNAAPCKEYKEACDKIFNIDQLFEDEKNEK